jgi:Zn-dependent peptidase ImmA (M78 family)
MDRPEYAETLARLRQARRRAGLTETDVEAALGLSFIVHFRDGNSSTGYDPQEVEANQFAAELLMPAERVREMFFEAPFDIDNERGLRKLAARFGVSPMSMAIRLSSLDLVVAA